MDDEQPKRDEEQTPPKPPRFSEDLYRKYLRLNSAYRANTRLDPQARYAARGIRTVDGRILASAELMQHARAVEQAFMLHAKRWKMNRNHFLVWLGCRVGFRYDPAKPGDPFVTAHPENNQLMSVEEAAREYRIAVTTADEYLTRARRAVQREYEAVLNGGSDDDYPEYPPNY